MATGIVKAGQSCLDLIRRFEGLKLKAYQDGGGVWTIGYGTTVYPTGVKVKKGDEISIAEANEYLFTDITKTVTKIASLTKDIPLTQQQFDALVCFAYNVGTGAFKSSTMLKKILVNPDDETIAHYRKDENGKPVIRSCEFLKWVIDNGKIIPGLINRRAAEADLYKSK